MKKQNMRKNILIIFTLFLMIGCCTTKKVQYVPIQGETIIEYRDTTIYLEKIVEVPVPVERVVEIVPKLDTLFMETSVAKSKAWVDTTNRVLRGRMENKQTALKGKLDTIVRIEYVDRYTEKEVAVEVPVEVPYIPNWMWGVCIYAALTVGIILMKIIGKFR